MAEATGPAVQGPTTISIIAGDPFGSIQRSRDSFVNLVDKAPFGVYVVDAHLCIYLVNAGAQAAFVNVRPLIGRPFAEAMHILWPEPFASEAVQRFLHTLATGDSYIAPSLIEERKDVGELHSFEWEIHRTTLPDGGFGVVCYFYDSTKLRQAERSLREASRRSDAALLAGEVGTYFWDILRDELTGDVNFVSMFDIELDANAPAPLSTFFNQIHPDDQARVGEQIQRTLEADAPFAEEYRILHSGGERWVISRGVVERNGEGKPAGWAGVLVDISDRKRAEVERLALLESERAARAVAERASYMKDEFLATLSHELRTPLSAILGWSRILAGKYAGEADLVEGLRTIERNARAQTQIIEDLLDMSRIISGKVRLDIQRVALASVVRSAIDTVRPAADAKGVRLELTVDPFATPISADPSRLQQVFWNLLSNAVKFTPRDRRVEVRVRRVDSSLEVSIADSGEGIRTDFLPHVFDRFRQADASSSRQHGGLGLGLAIVKQLVELHGGWVGASSDGPGLGATFTVGLPIASSLAGSEVPTATAPAEAVEFASQAAPGDDIAGVKILIVDDDPDTRALLRRLLEGCDAVVTVASSASEALDLLRAERPDILISDIGMPSEDGYSLIRRVRALSAAEGGNTVAIALTAYARAEDRVSALRAGFEHHTAKPVEPSELVAIVASAIRQVEPKR